MRLIEFWKVFTESLGTQGGSLALLTCILFAFFPLLLKNDSEGWKAAMFILGAIVGIINNAVRPTAVPSPPTPPAPPSPKPVDNTTILNLNG